MSEKQTWPVPESPRGRVLVVGGGIAGISAAIEAAEAGCSVVLVERAPQLGGRVAQLHQYFPKLCPPLCGLELNLRRLRVGQRLQCFTITQVSEIVPTKTALRATLHQRPRFVTERCTSCNACTDVCPAKRRSAFDFGMCDTKAIYLPHPSAHPALYAIDAATCLAPACRRCVEVCPAEAIDLSMAPREYELIVDAVIWTTGWRPYDPAALQDLGFGSHPDIITNVMMERMASLQGPTGGKIQCPSDGRIPKRVAFVQCAGSRDENHLEYCSGICCLASAKQARYVREVCPDAMISIHYIDRRATGNYERFLAATADDAQCEFTPGKVARIAVCDGKPQLEFENIATNRRQVEHVDLVVLATGMVPEFDTSPANSRLERDSHGFLMDVQPGQRQFPAGCARQPMDVAASVRDATAAVAKVLATCAAR